MSLLMSVFTLERKAGLILFLAVVTLTAVNGYLFLTPPQSASAKRVLAISPQVKQESKGRDVASVSSFGQAESISEAATGKLGRPVVLDHDLNSSKQDLKVDGTHVRLRGLMRGHQLQTVKNNSNGFTAAVFDRGGSYTTDFIELQEGSNEIALELSDKKGQAVIKKIKVERTPASVIPTE